MNTLPWDFVCNRVVYLFRPFIMPNLIPPKIPDGEKVDFDVSEEEKEINKIFYYKSMKKRGEPRVFAGYTS